MAGPESAGGGGFASGARPDAPFPETADIETSTDEYARRYAGAVGAWMLSVQERLARGFLDGLPAGASVLDVGGGHGQLAVPLARAGWDVTVLGSHPSCAHRLREAIDTGRCRFVVGNAVGLPFADRSFDAAISFRLLTHCARWTELVRELCRVARSRVVLDYPTIEGLNALAPALFGAKRKVEGDTRPWRMFRHDEVAAAFAANGFRPAGRSGEFLLPMILHRQLRWRAGSAAAEAVCAGLGLTRRRGSPVVARMDRAVP
jgi:SAM-dependent methyltransferase